MALKANLRDLKRALRACDITNQQILRDLKQALRACDITNPTVCAADPQAIKGLRLYVETWIEGPLEAAIEAMENKRS